MNVQVHHRLKRVNPFSFCEGEGWLRDSETGSGREETGLSPFVFLRQLYLNFSQGVIRRLGGHGDDCWLHVSSFFFLSSSVQFTFYRPPRPKTAFGPCLKVSRHIFRTYECVSALVVDRCLDGPTSKDIA